MGEEITLLWLGASDFFSLGTVLTTLPFISRTPLLFFLSLPSLPPSLPVPLLPFFLPFFPSIYSGSLGLFLRSGLKLSIEKLDFITKSQMPLLKMFYLFIFGQPIPCMSTFLISFYLIQMYSVSLSSCILERALLYIISPN